MLKYNINIGEPRNGRNSHHLQPVQKSDTRSSGTENLYQSHVLLKDAAIEGPLVGDVFLKEF